MPAGGKKTKHPKVDGIKEQFKLPDCLLTANCRMHGAVHDRTAQTRGQLGIKTFSSGAAHLSGVAFAHQSPAKFVARYYYSAAVESVAFIAHTFTVTQRK